MNKNKFLFITIIFSFIIFQKCKNNEVLEYIINDKYTGPCIIFSYPNKTYSTKINQIIVDDGFGRIKSSLVKNKFIFKSNKIGQNIEIISLGKELGVKEDKKYIFRLTKNQIKTDCNSKIIQTISFYFGLKKDYLEWRETNYSELKYFESIGVDWCSYYLAGSTSKKQK